MKNLVPEIPPFQLHRVPFNELKISQSFVMQMDHDREARAIVKTRRTVRFKN